MDTLLIEEYYGDVCLTSQEIKYRMNELETLPSHSDTTLQVLANDLDKFLGSQLELETGGGKTRNPTIRYWRTIPQRSKGLCRAKTTV